MSDVSEVAQNDIKKVAETSDTTVLEAQYLAVRLEISWLEI